MGWSYKNFPLIDLAKEELEINNNDFSGIRICDLGFQYMKGMPSSLANLKIEKADCGYAPAYGFFTSLGARYVSMDLYDGGKGTCYMDLRRPISKWKGFLI